MIRKYRNFFFQFLIRTSYEDKSTVITVADNGSGFKISDDSEPHIALSNIQQRLEMMCNGKHTVMPGENGGTTVKITIPDR